MIIYAYMQKHIPKVLCCFFLGNLYHMSIIFDPIGGLEKLRLVDFGSGDGRIVQMAALKGMRATGYELNPCPWGYGGHREARGKSTGIWMLMRFVVIYRSFMVYI